jgi:hypothetical protein
MNFSKIKKTLVAGVLGAVVLTSCKQDPLGPELISAPNDFVKNVNLDMIIAGSSENTVKFYEDENAYFKSSTFSHSVTWTLILKGGQSGAEMSFSSTGKKVNTTDAHWLRGETSTIQFFQQGEKFAAELHIVGLDSVFTTSDSLTYESDFDWHGQTIDGVTYAVIDYFEIDQNPQGLSATSPDGNDDGVLIRVSNVTRINGEKSLMMAGFDANSNGWLGDINHERLLEFVNVNSIAALPVDSSANIDDLYFNLYVFGDSKFPNTAVELKIYENDDTTLKSRVELMALANDATNILGGNLQAVSDAWIYDIQINWDGWKLVSLPYSSFRAANSPLKGGGGNRIKQPWRMTGIAVSILSYPTAGEEVSTYVDFLTVTQGGRPKY